MTVNLIGFRRENIAMKTKNIICSTVTIGLLVGFVTGCATPLQKEEKAEAKGKKKTTLTSNQVPGPVRQVFQAKFPTVSQVEWKIKGDQNYEAEFTLEGTIIAAKFDPMGKWLETERAITQPELPQAVRNTADERFKGYTVVETQSLQSWDAKSLAYELHFENAKEIVKAAFSSDGVLLKQSAKPKTGSAK
jgi:hypothetical protein